MAMGISFDTLDYARDLVTAEHNLNGSHGQHEDRA